MRLSSEHSNVFIPSRSMHKCDDVRPLMPLSAPSLSVIRLMWTRPSPIIAFDTECTTVGIGLALKSLWVTSACTHNATACTHTCTHTLLYSHTNQPVDTITRRCPSSHDPLWIFNGSPSLSVCLLVLVNHKRTAEPPPPFPPLPPFLSSCALTCVPHNASWLVGVTQPGQRAARVQGDMNEDGLREAKHGW